MIALPIAYVVLLVVRYALARRAIRRHRVEPEPAASLDLTILCPILSGDPTMEPCLYEVARGAPRGIQLVWLVDEDDAEGRRIADAFDSAEIACSVRVELCPPAPPNSNPKSDKLARALPHVATEFVAVLDDDTIVGAVHLAAAIAALEGRGTGPADLYTGLPTYSSEGGVGSHLVAAFVNSSSSLTYLPPAALVAPITINGMFYVTRTEALRRLGGFEAIREELCDDLAMAQLFVRSGKAIQQGATAQRLRSGGMGLGAYVTRMHRWFVFANVLFRGLPLGRRLGYGAALGAPPLLLWGSFAAAATGAASPLAVVALLALRHALLLDLLRRTREFGSPVPSLHVVFSVVTELAQPLHALHATLRPVIRWRSRMMRVNPDGTFQSLSSDA